MNKHQRTYTAYLLIGILMVSTIGVAVHARWCACNQETYFSFFVKSMGDCCDHHNDTVAATPSATCCAHTTPQSCSAEAQIHSCTVQADKGCCETDSDFLVLDEDYAPTTIEKFEGCKCCLAHHFTPPITLIAVHTFSSNNLPIARIKTALPDRAPPKKYGRQLLSFVQIYRC